MIEQVNHPAFPPPDSPDTYIWRYLTAGKFEWLVKESRLFMPNAAHLGDPLEGMQPSGDANWWQSLADRAKSESERCTIEHNRQLITRFAAAFRTRYYVSCWHINESINYSMWKRYAPTIESVAVRTKVAKLRAALPAYIDIGIVRYIDYAFDRLPTLNMLEYITHKNKCYKCEQELRAIAMHPVLEGLGQKHFRNHHFEKEQDASFRVFAPPINIADFLEEVFIHPDATQSFAEQVKSQCKATLLPAPRRAEW